MKKLLSIEGMSCNHCVMHVKEALASVSGVDSAEVSLEDKRAIVTGQSFDDEALKAAVEDAGYEIVGIGQEA